MILENSISAMLSKQGAEISLADAVFNGTGDGIIIVDRNFEILFENNATKECVGDNLGKKCYQAYQKNDKPCEICPAALSLKDGLPHRAEKKIPVPEGSLYIEVMSSPIKNKDGKIIATVEITRNITARKQLEKEKEELIAELQDTLEKVKVLSGFIPICAHCKNIRDDKGFWTQVEDYIRENSEAEFTHGICPDCATQVYKDLETLKGKCDGP